MGQIARPPQAPRRFLNQLIKASLRNELTLGFAWLKEAERSITYFCMQSNAAFDATAPFRESFTNVKRLFEQPYHLMLYSQIAQILLISESLSIT